MQKIDAGTVCVPRPDEDQNDLDLFNGKILVTTIYEWCNHMRFTHPSSVLLFHSTLPHTAVLYKNG